MLLEFRGGGGGGIYVVWVLEILFHDGVILF